MAGTVLVVEDHDRVRRALTAELRRADFQTLEAADGEQGWREFARNRPDLVITDLVMPVRDGQSFLERVTAESSVPVLMYSSRGTIRAAVDALKAGAVDFMSSEDTTIDDIVRRARSALELRRRQDGQILLEERLAGTSREIQRLREGIASVAPLPDPVLVTGEPGSGRAGVVGILHALSYGDRQPRPEFHELDCLQRPDSLPEDGGGSFFLRDVHRLGRNAQARWATHLVRRRRKDKPEPGRVFASTSLSLRSLQDAGFHHGLFRLLSPCALHVPSIRSRSQDLKPIVDTLIEQFASGSGRSVTLSAEARQLIEMREWPGNLAQLSRVLRRAFTFARGRVVQAERLREILAEEELSASHFRNEHNEREREVLIHTMRETGGNVKRTAEIMGKSRAAIYRLLEKHRASCGDFR